jgi:glycosyltransferase involved in cell wall biosynthesis
MPSTVQGFESNVTHAPRPTIWAISEYYQPNFSGAAIQAQHILSRLAAEGHSVHVLTAADQAARHLAREQRVVDGVHIHYLPVMVRRDWSSLARIGPLAQGGRAASDLLRDASFHRQILRTLRRHAQPGDILQWYVIGEFTWTVFRAAGRRQWQNVIQISLIGADDPGSLPSGRLGISTALKRYCFRRADRVIGLSRALTDSCLRAGLDPARVVRIANGVQLDRFPPSNPSRQRAVRAALGLDPNRQYLAFVGSALHRKGIDVVVEAFIQIAHRLPNVDLLVVGPCNFQDTTRHDPSRQQLIRQLNVCLEQAGCEARVHWVGQVENVVDYLRAADVFFFPTRREGLPNALAEAMASGLPVVTARLPGITTDLVDEGIEGRLIEGHEPGPYAQAVIDLFENPDEQQRMGRRARERIVHEFDLKQVVGKYASQYEQLSRERLPMTRRR